MYDGVIQSKLHYQDHEDVLYHEQTQPTEDLILEYNAELRKNPGAIKDLGAGQEGGTWGRMVATIPMIMLEKAVRNGYDLYNRDAEIASKEMHRFLQSADGQLCLIRG